MKIAKPTQQREPAADTEPMHARLRSLIEAALRAQPYTVRERPGDADPVLIKQPTARGMTAFLETQTLPALFNKSGELIRTPKASSAATTIRLEAAVIANSRVAQAGAHIFVHAEPSKALATGLSGVVVMETRPAAFRVIEAAQFETVADIPEDADVNVSPLPVSAAAIDFSQAIKKGFRVELPRSARKDVSDELLCSEIVVALTLGLARAADEVLLSAIAATSPANFSLALAAAQGLKFSELRAIVGTGGTGAAVGQDGTLRAAGIPAELSADTNLTLVGAFTRAGVAIHEAIDVYLERTGRNGTIAATAWSSMLPLLPDASKFWTVPAAP